MSIFAFLQRLLEALLYFANKSDQRKRAEVQADAEKQEERIDNAPVDYFNEHFNGVRSDSGELQSTGDDTASKASATEPEEKR